MAKNPFNTSAQNLVYHLDVGIGPLVLKGVLYVMFFGLIGLLFMATQYQGFASPRAMDQAQLARRFSETGKLQTQVIRPGDLKLLQDRGLWQPGQRSLQEQPDLVNAPLYPMVIGSAFKVLGTEFPAVTTAKYPPEQWVIIPLNLLFCLLSGMFMYLAGKRLFSQRVALLGVTIYLLSASLWKGAISGTEISLVAMLAALAFWSYATILMDEAEQGIVGTKLWIFVAVGAVSLAALFLTRYATILLVPAYILALFLALGRRAIVPAIATLGVVGAIATPWMLRNMSLTGNPFGFAPIYAIHGELGHVFMRSFLEVDERNFNLVRGVIARLLRSAQIGLTFQEVFLANGLVLSLAVATFFYGFKRPAVRQIRWTMLLSYLLLIVAAGFFGETQYEVTAILTPIVILYGCAFLFLLMDRMILEIPFLTQSLLIGFVAIQSLPLVVTLMPPKPSSYPPYFARDIQLVSEPFAREELLCTDMPWATAWYGGQTSLYLPSNIEHFFILHDTVQPVSCVYLTLLSRDQPYHSELIRGNERSWKPIMDLNPLPRGWPLRSAFPIRGGDSVVLADRNRWSEK